MQILTRLDSILEKEDMFSLNEVISIIVEEESINYIGTLLQ